MTDFVEPPRCPVCQARFRGTPECSRCGADLQPLMILAARAYQSRQAARQALLRGDFAGAHTLASQSQSLCFTQAGETLRLLSLLLLMSEECQPGNLPPAPDGYLLG